MRQGLIYVIGVAFSRGILLILGALIAHCLGEPSYVQFVLFITMANIITNFSLMGVSPRILAHPNKHRDTNQDQNQGHDLDQEHSQNNSHHLNSLSRSKPNNPINFLNKSSKSQTSLLEFQYGGIINFILAFSITTYLFLHDFRWFEKLGDGMRPLLLISVFLYSAGYFFLSLSSALLNREKRHAAAGYRWILISALSFVMGSVFIFFTSYSLFLTTFSFVWAAVGFESWWIIRTKKQGKESNKEVGLEQKKSEERNKQLKNKMPFKFPSSLKLPSISIILSMMKSIYSSLFGLPFLVVFFLLGQQVNFSSDIDNKAAFFLGFQLFSIILFIPGALGSVFVPRLSQAMSTHKRKLIFQLSSFYFLVGLGWLILIYLILPYLFQWYGISPNRELFVMVLVWQIAGIFAALGAIQNQLLVAFNDYSFLLLGSLIWAALVLLISTSFENAMLGGAIGTLVSYIILQCLYGYKNKKHLQTKKTQQKSEKLLLINYLANSTSAHVCHWERLLKLAGYDMVVHTIHSGGKTMLLGSTSKRLIPSLFNALPDIGKYVIAGILLRINPKYASTSFFHAHNTSGYGLTAWLSGKPYIVTTYGSEIFNSQQRGKFYSFLLNRILKKATLITSTSSAMTAYLMHHFGIPQSKIYEFSLGVSPAFSYNSTSQAKFQTRIQEATNSPIWIANRRIRPLYHTLEIVQAFIDFRDKFQTGFLILLEGDSLVDYRKKVELACLDNPYIKLIKGFVSQEDLSDYLSASDFSISVPETDQLSSSILEAATCGAVPLLSSLTAYRPLSEFSRMYNIEETGSSQSYESIFSDSYQFFISEEYQKCKQEMIEKVKQFGMDKVLPNVLHLYQFSSETLSKINHRPEYE